jgi:hypothetical protein
MKTLNQLKKLLVTFFENHKQVNSVYYSDDFSFNAERSLNYPVCNIEYLESNMANKKLAHSYRIVLGDLLDANIEGHEDEILSDMMLIAEDFFAWLQYNESFEFIKSSSIQKFSDDTSDRVSGLVFRISISTIRTANTCIIPTEA